MNLENMNSENMNSENRLSEEDFFVKALLILGPCEIKYPNREASPEQCRYFKAFDALARSEGYTNLEIQWGDGRRSLFNKFFYYCRKQVGLPDNFGLDIL